MLYLIGLGLGNEKDITIKGLEAVKRCDKVYLERYTSLLQCSIEDLERFYLKKVIPAQREDSEQGMEKIVEEAQRKDVAFLIVGDPFSATTHTGIYKLAQEKKVPIVVINNASILTAIGMTGLQLYHFGKVTSIPFPENVPNLETPYNVLVKNQEHGLHTLFLLDLNPRERKFMTIPEAIQILEKIEKEKKRVHIFPELFVVGCARLGSDDFLIKAGKLMDVKNVDFGKPPYCLIIPGKMHFSEEEMLEIWK